MFDIGLPSKKCLYQIQAERIRRLEQLANEQCTGNQANIPWLARMLYRTMTITGVLNTFCSGSL